MIRQDKSDFKNFDAAVQKILSVSHDELKRREEEWKKQHKGRKAGRKRSSRKRARE
jgi:hypothetical protein